VKPAGLVSAETIQAGLETEVFGRHVVYWPEVASTNDEARQLARRGAAEGTLVITDYQSAGRGRLSRRWVAPAGSSLLTSLIFRPLLAPHQVQQLTMVCGLAVSDAVASQTDLHVGLKWPNDLIVGQGKVGGILTELELEADRVRFVVVGIGLNVNLDPGQLPKDLLMPASSLSHESGQDIARLPLLWAMLQAIESRYMSLRMGESPQAEWQERLVTLGRQVTVSQAGSEVEGVAEGVDANGALLVRLASGDLKTVVAGDVTLRARG
jgi:BirA family biotin operon repressor/biotin-[acetyl-CoA-carboxylase] ligase